MVGFATDDQLTNASDVVLPEGGSILKNILTFSLWLKIFRTNFDFV